ncbi:hypothetical protein ABH963_000142 [Bacillus sp. RC55]|uniref:hypothetical protein n=1 Tax=unclassified Bacillus (in: firmicutes) TaxID=185979 RepID=UPI003838D6A4
MLHPLKLPIPEGYSEFLLCAGYWRYGEEIKSSVDEEILVQYERKTVLENGKLYTKFIYKGNQKKRDGKS